jgi:hypothetical protein
LHQNERAAAIEARCRIRLEDVLDGLDLAELVAAADAAEHSIEGGFPQADGRSGLTDVAVPGPIESVQPFRELVEAQLAMGDVQPEQAHAATDVGADQLRKDAIRQDRATDRAVLAGMKIRHRRHSVHAQQSGDLLELLGGVSLDPGPG